MAGSFSHFLERSALEIFRRPGSNFAALDGMRGFASVIVVFYHCALFSAMFTPDVIASGRFRWLFPLLNGMWSGIDIFFVLSGFLIGRLLLIDLSKWNTIYYRRFLIRRFCRIFPAYYLVLLIAVFVISQIDFPLRYFLFGSADSGKLVADSWANFVYVNNYVSPGKGIFSWGWSLCVEEHFYLILPPLLWLLFRYGGPRIQLSGILACVILPLLGRAVQYMQDPGIRLVEGFYYYSHNRFDEIFFGVIVAYFYVCRRDALSRFAEHMGNFMWILGLVCVGSVWIFGGLQVGGAFAVVWQFSVMAMGSALFLVNGLFTKNVVSRFFSNPAWYPLARISYGTFLIHPFVLFFFLNFRIPVTEFGLIAVFLLVMSVSSIIAALMFAVVENQFLKIGIGWARQYGPDRIQPG